MGAGLYLSPSFSTVKPRRKVGIAHFFFGPEAWIGDMKDLQDKIEIRLAELDPEIELISLEHPAPDALRLYIDGPDGVDLALCERVTKHLRDLLIDYSLEVSSPGAERPLTKPEHFRRFRGRQVRVRTREALDGRQSFTGTIADVDDDGVSVDLADGAVTIPHERIRRSNLVPDGSEA
jgi:ribosome maturation factor RimP